MNTSIKDAQDIVPDDFRISPVWEFTNDDEGESDTLVKPVCDLPVSSLANRFVGTQVRLANGQTHWAILDGIDPDDPFKTRHFLSLSIYRGEWFHLARYHDPEIDLYGPDALAAFLGLRATDIFPISYDVRAICEGDAGALKGTIVSDPQERLSRSQIIALAVP